jgi:hypothetical protein
MTLEHLLIGLLVFIILSVGWIFYKIVRVNKHNN